MACNGITNVTAQIALDLAPLVENETLARAAAQGLGSLLGLHEAPVQISPGNGYVILWVGGDIGVTVYAGGELSCTDFRPGGTTASAEAIRQAAEQIVTALAGLALQSRLAGLIGQLAPIETTQRAENGALVLTVDL